MRYTSALALILLIVLLSTACNLPASAGAPPPAATSPAPAATYTPEPATPTLPPADLPFTIDCSALPAARQPDCDDFIAATRDQVYPLLRDITGVSLSACYDSIHYTILPNDPAPGVGGSANANQITYAKTYSVDLPHRYDVHELLHSISQCTGALDDHIFHGIILNYVYSHLLVRDAGYFTDRSNPVELNDYLLEAITTSSGPAQVDQCRGILANQMTIAYFDVGEGAILRLYHSTIAPEPAVASNQQLAEIWGAAAPKVQALLDTLEQEFKYPIDVPACGY